MQLICSLLAESRSRLTLGSVQTLQSPGIHPLKEVVSPLKPVNIGIIWHGSARKGALAIDDYAEQPSRANRIEAD